MLNPDLPTTFLRDAWCRVRLDSIREAVSTTLDLLQELGVKEAGMMGAPRPGAETARAAALMECSAELLRESGLPTSYRPPQARSPQRDEDWTRSYDEALLHYRTTAVSSLRKSFRWKSSGPKVKKVMQADG